MLKVLSFSKLPGWWKATTVKLELTESVGFMLASSPVYYIVTHTCNDPFVHPDENETSLCFSVIIANDCDPEKHKKVQRL